MLYTDHSPPALTADPIRRAAPPILRAGTSTVSGTANAARRRAGSMTPTQVGEAVFDSHRFVNLFRKVRKPRPACAEADRE